MILPDRPEIVLFDLDGTLSDSAEGILAALRLALAENGVPPLDAATEQGLLGPPFYDSLPPLIGGVERLPAVLASYRVHYGDGLMFRTQVFDGVAEVLAAARAAGRTLAVATSKPESYAMKIMDHLDLSSSFETIGGDELDGSLATKALVIDKVLGRLERPEPDRVVMIGDRLHDVVGAREHGIACIGAGWGYAPAGELEAARPATICAHPRELLTVLGLAPDPAH